ncbi:trichohyalin-like isoform X1 [Stylophora pistillata]|uniref:trichohyalin-like isoform X1 n=1 Tax=Stylophora pistillata TaxID=50429 RepID=UPI000C0562FC|nr:trichohyalin-like isoform X1 [Stylophora pistillata]
MSELRRRQTKTSYGTRRESLEFTNDVESLATNEDFIQNLIKLPEELKRLQSENERLKEAKASRSRVDSPSQATISEKWLQDRLEAKEKELRRKYKERFSEERKRFEQQLQANTETLQKNNDELNKNLNQSSKENQDLRKKLKEYECFLQERSSFSHRYSRDSQNSQENQDLRKKLKEYERLLQERSSVSHRYSRDSQKFNYEQQIMKARQVSEGYRRELDRFKERHAAVSERRVRSDQRRTENTLSTNRQSQLESDYVIEFKDGTRVDAIDVMTSKSGRRRGNNSTSMEYLKCCRFACFIFEVAYEVVVKVKESFVKFTSSVMETLAAEAPALGSDSTSFQNKLWKTQYNNTKSDVHATQDAVSELMILVKEKAKTHDLDSVVQDVKRSISEKWSRQQLQRGSFLLEYDSDLLYRLNGYIKYCTQFAWCAVTQVPPLKIDCKTTGYDSKVHEVSQAFSPSEERSPSRRAVYSETRNIMCYLWPALVDCDGKVIRKGEVLLS